MMTAPAWPAPAGEPLRVGVVVGTRPEAIKLAPVVVELRRCPRLETTVIGTAQHGRLLDQQLVDLALRVDVQLAPVRGDGNIGTFAGQCLSQLSRLLPALHLDALVVQGDTATCLSASLAAFYLGVPVVHVEAGLRSGRRSAPYPEEVNRRLVTQIADLHLAPTGTARAHLLAEGVSAASIRVTGNPVLDTIAVRDDVPFTDSRILRAVTEWPRLIVATMHRRESWGAPMRRLARALRRIAESRPDVAIVLPAHPNPLVRDCLSPLSALPNVVVSQPLPRSEFLRLLAAADLALTDSGGVQEEAPSLGVPVLVLRDCTERVEGLELGLAHLTGTDPERVVRNVERLLDRPARSRRTEPATPNPYGDGRASARCVEAILDLLLPERVGSGSRRQLVQ